MTASDAPVVIVGGGPAGLATASELKRLGVRYRLLEKGGAPGFSWRNLYDSLTLHTGKHLSALPGLPFPAATPLFPTRRDFVAYLEQYASTFGIDIETATEVTRARRDDDGWALETTAGPMRARSLVVATGLVSAPRMPEFPGRELFGGRVTHSIEYRRPDDFIGRRVLVVGVGNSGGEIGSELADAGAHVTVSVRSGANVVPLTILGVPIQYIAYGMRNLPKPVRRALANAVGKLSEAKRGPPVLPRPAHGPLDAIPLIGFHLVDAIRAGRVRVAPGIDRFTRDGVRFTDGTEQSFDDVLMATGFRTALEFLDEPVRTDEKGFALRSGRVRSADVPGLYFVGHSYDSTGGLMNIATDSRLAAAAIARQEPPVAPTPSRRSHH